MRARIDIDHALVDRNLLGAALGDLAPWKVWRVVLKAAFALGLGTDEERAIFEEISGGRPLPAKRLRELCAIVARRGGMLIGISTPYRRIGLLHQKHRDYFGVDDPDVLVVAGASQQFNPTLDSSVIERARASDPEAARAEWDAEFRSDIGALLDDQTIE